MKEMRRVLALVLCMVMLIGIIPAGAFAAEDDVTAEELAAAVSGEKAVAEETEEQTQSDEIQHLVSAPEAALTVEAEGKTLVDAAIFASDIHSGPDTAKSIMQGVATSGLTYSSATFVGDTYSDAKGTAATGVTPYIQEGLSDENVQVMYTWGDHDYQVTDIADYTGLIYGTSETNYYIYAISMSAMTDMGDSKTECSSTYSEELLTKFTSDVECMDHTKPLFIATHMPLHARRGDNDYAYNWYQVIEAAANKMDVVVFWAHNHTGDNGSNYDSTCYFMKPGTQIEIQGATEKQTLNFTYANAGYINPPNGNGRKNVATSVAIYEDSMEFVVYAAKGQYSSSTFATGGTVDRLYEAVATLTGIAVTTAPTTTEYTVGDTFSTEGMVVTATYSDGTTAPITDYTVSEVDMTTAGTKTVTVTYQDKTATFDITVSEAATEPSEPAGPTTITFWDDYETVTIQATATGLTEGTAANVSGEIEALDAVYTDYVALDITLTGAAEGAEVAYSILVVENMDTTNMTVYHVDGDTLTPVACEVVTDAQGNQYVEFTSDLTGTFAYGSPVVPEGYAIDSISIEGIPYDVFVGTSVDLTDSTITATYTKDGAEDFIRVLTVYDYDLDNFSEFDVNTLGKQTIIFTFDGAEKTFDINVWGEEFTVDGVTVHVGAGEYGVSSVTVKESENEHVASAVAAYVGESEYVAYDISMNFEGNYQANGEVKTVTLPVPENITKPVVYYLSDDGVTVTDMGAVVSEDGKTVTFTTDHFSTYVLADGTSIETESGNATVEGTLQPTYTTETVTIYKKVSAPVSGNSYLIVSSENGTGYGLNGTTTGYATTAFPGEGNYYSSWDSSTNTGVVWSGEGTYLTTSNAYLWTAAQSGDTWAFGNSGTYVGYATTSSDGFMSTSYTNTFSFTTDAKQWTLGDNQATVNLKTYEGSLSGSRYSDYYLACENGTWTMAVASELDSTNVYFFEPAGTAIKVTETSTGTVGHVYSAEGTDITDAVAISGQTVTLSSVLYDTPDGGTKTDITASSKLTPTYEVVTTKGNPAVISEIENGVATLSGTVGTAVVKVTYTSGDLVAWDEFIVTANAPVYDLSITDSTTQLKIGETYAFTAQPTVNGTEISGTVTWSSSDESIATVGEDGVVTGVAAGSATIAASWTDAKGTVHEKSVNLTVVDAVYVVSIVQGDSYLHKGVKANDTLQLTATVTKDGEAVDNPTLKWEIESGTSATISETGVVTFKGVEGTVTVRVSYTSSLGTTVTDKIVINARVSSATKPGDAGSHDDFPAWGHKGSVRFDKTATAVGDFSKTGTAMVELSMAGIPAGGPVDIIVSLDWTDSMKATVDDNDTSSTSDDIDRYAAAIDALQAFLLALMIDDDGTLNENRVLIHTFKGTTVNHLKLNSATATNEFESITTSMISGYAGNTTKEKLSAFLEAAITETIINDLTNTVSVTLDTGYANSSSTTTGSTYYSYATKAMYDKFGNATYQSAAAGRGRYNVFMTDGGPSAYYYAVDEDTIKVNDNGTVSCTYYRYSHNEIGEWVTGDSENGYTADAMPELYTTKAKLELDVEVFAVGLGVDTVGNPYSGGNQTWDFSDAQYEALVTGLLNVIASESDEYETVFPVTDGGAGDGGLSEAFTKIAGSVKSAASNVEVEDQISEHYEITFAWPSAVLDDDKVENQEFYLEVIQYTLGTDNERTGEYAILQRIYLNTDADGNVTGIKETGAATAGGTYTADASPAPTFVAASEDEDAYFNWTDTDGDGVYDAGEPYSYASTGNGDAHMASGAYYDADKGMLHTRFFTYNFSTKTFYWTVTQLTKANELAMRYFVYLENSMETVYGELEDGEEPITAGPYVTNNYAVLSYTNHLDHLCEQTFPVPQLTWNGAQVSYVFYLVNENGQPVNRSGEIVESFNEAVFVTDIFTEEVIWNDTAGVAELDKNFLASVLLPENYELYDQNATYRVYVHRDAGTSGSDKYNYFVIEGSTADALKNAHAADKADSGDITTTKVYNTKGGTKYVISDYYEEGANLGIPTYTTNDTQVLYSAYSTSKQSITEDGVTYDKVNVLKATEFDYGATTVAFAVTWKVKLTEDTVVVDFGLPVEIDVTANDFIINKVTGIGTAKPDQVIDTGTYNTPTFNSMTIDAEHYSAYATDAIIRFEQKDMIFNEPVKFFYEAQSTYYVGGQETTPYMYSSVTVIPATTVYYEDSFLTLASYSKQEDGTFKLDEEVKWTQEGTTISATQDQDRPGESLISDQLDADNPYGYDSAYEECSTFSLGSARKITVNEDRYATAEFEFYGTGFDIISMTSNTTGSLAVRVYAWNESSKAFETRHTVSRIVDTYYGFAYEDDEWVPVEPQNPNAIYQVPVMKVSGLDYGRYKAVIVSSYTDLFDHTGTGSFEFYLDAIRIYDPCKPNDDTANGAYAADGEGYPEYTELRNLIIDAATFYGLNSATVSGVVFIDGATTDPDGNVSISDYTNFGPNNELYLAFGQSVAGYLDAGNAASVQLAIKTVGGEGAVGAVEIYGVDNANKTVTDESGKTVGINEKINTATDLYYDITGLNKSTIVIKNTGSAIISITNIKCTYAQAPVYPVSMVVTEKDGTASATVTYSDESTKETTKLTTTTTEKKITYTYTEKVNSTTYTVTVTKDVEQSGGNATAAFYSPWILMSDGDTEEEALYLFTVNADVAQRALLSMREPIEEEPVIPEGSEPDGDEPDESEPDDSEPEGSEPEGSEPEGSEPDGSEPEGSEPDSSEPDESQPEESVPSEPAAPEETEPEEKESIEETVRDIIEIVRDIIGIIGGFFGGWF